MDTIETQYKRRMQKCEAENKILKGKASGAGQEKLRALLMSEIERLQQAHEPVVAALKH